MQRSRTLYWLALSLVLALSRTATGAGTWQPHEVRQISGTAGVVRLPAQFQIVTETWKRVVAVSYLLHVLHHWVGHIREGPTAWCPSSQATSTVLLPDGSLLTAFGTGYRCQDIVKGQPAPRDVGLVKWRLNPSALTAETRLRDAPFDLDLRNVYDPNRQ